MPRNIVLKKTDATLESETEQEREGESVRKYKKRIQTNVVVVEHNEMVSKEKDREGVMREKDREV